MPIESLRELRRQFQVLSEVTLDHGVNGPFGQFDGLVGQLEQVTAAVIVEVILLGLKNGLRLDLLERNDRGFDASVETDDMKSVTGLDQFTDRCLLYTSDAADDASSV